MIGRLLYTLATAIRRVRAWRLPMHAPLCGTCSAEFSKGNYPAGAPLQCWVCRYARTWWRYDGGQPDAAAVHARAHWRAAH